MSSTGTSNGNSNTSMSVAPAKFEKPKIIAKPVNDYVLKVGFSESEVAKELRLETAKHARAVMMGDPIETAMFKVLLPAMGAKRVIEVGVFTGYTTLIMAEAMGPDSKIVGLDVSEEFTNIAKPYWEKAQVSDRIDLRIAPALESLEKLLKEPGNEGTYDFAFLDADKVNYKQYYELLLKLIRKDGMIAVDNVLWSCRVLDTVNHNDDDTVAIRALSEFIQTDDRVEHVLLPFADGVTLVRKK